MAAMKPHATLASLGLPTTWWHGTTQAFKSLSTSHNMPGVIWLADLSSAKRYADKYYVTHERKWVIRVELAPDTRVADLTDPSEPLVDEVVALINDASKGRGMPWVRTRDEWLLNRFQYGELETYPFIVRNLKSLGVDAIVVNDVAEWSGHRPIKSLALITKKRIVSEHRYRLADVSDAHPNQQYRGTDMEPKIVLPGVFENFWKPVAAPPHRAPVIARYTDSHGVEYRVVRNRTATTWWLMSSKDGYKMSRPLKTTSKKIADGWLEAMAEERFVVASRATANGARPRGHADCHDTDYGDHYTEHRCSGRCRACWGVGSVPCPRCKDVGEGVCNYCGSEGETCIACHGKGYGS